MTEIKIAIKTSIFVFWIISLTISMLLLYNTIPVEIQNIFIYIYIFSILFIPGLLIQHIFGLYNRDFVTTVLFSICLSISFITFTLILANAIIYTFNDVLFTRFKLLIVFLTSFLFLGFIAIKKVKKITLTAEFSAIPILFGFLLFITTLTGTLILKITNLVLLAVFFLFMILPILIKFINNKYYPFLIWIFSLSLVFYNSIFGIYPRPVDNIYEIFTINEFVLKNGIWEQIAPNNILAMPNVVLFVPFLSSLTKSLVEIYKYIIPFIASFIPLAVYKIAEYRYNSTFAFFSSYFFSSLFIYFTWCSIIAKMVFAGLFLAVLGVILCKGIRTHSEKILVVLFSISLIFSRYGTSAIFAIGLLFSISLIPIFLKRDTKLVSFTLLYAIAYYSYSIIATKGSIFSSVTLTIANTIKGITELLTPRNYGSELLLTIMPPYLQVLKVIYIFAFIFALVEFIYIVLKDKHKIDEFLIISIVLLILIPLPYMLPVGQYGGGRIWFISGIFISCFVIAGLNRVSKYFRLLNWPLNYKILVSFVVIFFFFNSGLAAETIWKYNVGPSVYLSYPRIVKSGDLWEKEYLDRESLDINDITSASWLRFNIKKDININIYIDRNSVQNLVFVGFSRKDVKNIMGNMPYLRILTCKDIKISTSSYTYAYLNKFNIENKVIIIGGRIKPELININKIIDQQKIFKIYTNGGSEIYLKV